MNKFIKHPLIKPNTVEQRLYQEVMVAQILEKGNSLVVAPTALGKTVIAALLIAELLKRNCREKILFLSPTKPLAVQHQTRMKEFLQIEGKKINVLTGANPPEKRKQIWDDSIVISATPQTIENDILTGKITFDNVQLVVFDEAHRAVKDYSYVFLAKKFIQKQNKKILGLTASPGSQEEEIQDICKSLFIENILVKTNDDPDVKPYLNEIKVEWKKVRLPGEFHQIKNHLHIFIKEQLLFFKKIGYAKKIAITSPRRFDLLQLQIKLRKDMLNYGAAKPQLYQAVSRSAALLKVMHAVTLLESQGPQALEKYLEKMENAGKQSGSPKATKLIMSHPGIKKVFKETKELTKQKIQHPKLTELNRILQQQFSKSPDSRVLVFNHYRDSINHVAKNINEITGIRAAKFIGQATKSEKDKGLSQKKQIETLEKFKEGEYNTLVASSVAEEGLDIPSVDLVVFYEPVPSEIRLIQRRGRTGRKQKGKVIILMAEKTMDEAMYWASRKKESNMHSALKRLSSHSHTIQTQKKQTTLVQHALNKNDDILIYADNREMPSTIIRELSEFENVKVISKQLETGDFVLGPAVIAERKTVEDFVSSIIDGRLLNQMLSMSQSYSNPLLLLEGNIEDLFAVRNVHENAIIGMLTTIALTYRIPILFTKNVKDTARYLYVIAKREQQGKDKEIRLRLGRKGLTLEEQQQFIVESLPGVGPTLAKSLLSRFGSVEKVFNAPLEKLKEAEKVGPKKAQNIRKVLSKPFNKKEEDKTPKYSEELPND
jgi:Fanconi anemia group M protein